MKFGIYDLVFSVDGFVVSKRRLDVDRDLLAVSLDGNQADEFEDLEVVVTTKGGAAIPKSRVEIETIPDAVVTNTGLDKKMVRWTGRDGRLTLRCQLKKLRRIRIGLAGFHDRELEVTGLSVNAVLEMK